ncbi:MAG: hypothetical protein MZV64_01815 [Ignavibacteriales bacterium]|nr:hypothetical protein [Ignavibacteriales bacterium]
MGDVHQSRLCGKWMTQATIIALRADHPALGVSLFLPAGRLKCSLHRERNQPRTPVWHIPHSPYTKDAFHRYMVQGEKTAVNPSQTGTKARISFPNGLRLENQRFSGCAYPACSTMTRLNILMA